MFTDLFETWGDTEHTEIGWKAVRRRERDVICWFTSEIASMAKAGWGQNQTFGDSTVTYQAKPLPVALVHISAVPLLTQFPDYGQKSSRGRLKFLGPGTYMKSCRTLPSMN